MIIKQVKQRIQFPYVQGSLELSQSLSIRLQTLIPRKENEVYIISTYEVPTAFPKLSCSLSYNRMFSLFVFLTLYLFWNPKWWEQGKWCEQNGRGTRKLFRNYYHTPLTAEIKLKNQSLKPPEKVLRILAGYITKWFQELKHILCILCASWEARKLNGQKKMI